MKKVEPAQKERLFGLIGYPLSHSFSKKYFTQKFESEGISGCRYELFPLENLDDLPDLWRRFPGWAGMNVTIPYKEKVMAFLDELDPEAEAVGAVNTIRFLDGKKRGFNTDIFGFEHTLKAFLGDSLPEHALVLGTGGASKAVAFVLKKLGISFQKVSRRPAPDRLTYADLTPECIEKHHLIINTTPLGTAPRTENAPPIPYEALTNAHFLYDLVYNPEKTLFLARGESRRAKTCNGLKMLYLQAERAWEIWNQNTS
ncbi:MAG: shikimate dehydrogenase [Bacteroidetes bacterium]|nr:MAG: shikimate dehydrogenase [Bacteroidota bacterium]